MFKKIIKQLIQLQMTLSSDTFALHNLYQYYEAKHLQTLVTPLSQFLFT